MLTGKRSFLVPLAVLGLIIVMVPGVRRFIEPSAKIIQAPSEVNEAQASSANTCSEPPPYKFYTKSSDNIDTFDCGDPVVLPGGGYSAFCNMQSVVETPDFSCLNINFSERRLYARAVSLCKDVEIHGAREYHGGKVWPRNNYPYCAFQMINNQPDCRCLAPV